MGTGKATRLMSVAAVAVQLDCSRAHVYRLISVGKLHTVELKATGTRSKTRVKADEVEAFITAHTRTA